MSDYSNLKMPPQPVQPLPPGATSINNAGFIKSQQQTDQLMALIGKSGGKRSGSKGMRGGVPQIPVPAVPFNSPNAATTSNTYTALAKLTAENGINSTFDNDKTQAQTATSNTQQLALYKSGGKRKSRKSKKSKKSRKSRKGRKSKKSRK